jgi:hypothetical protein
MRKKLNAFINIFMGGLTAVYAAGAICKYFDYKNHPDLYEMQSAPWYTGIQITGIALVIILIICMGAKVAIQKFRR